MIAKATIKREGFSFRKKVNFSILTFLMSFFFFIPSVSASSGFDFSSPLKWSFFLVIVGLMLFLVVIGIVSRLPHFLILGFLLLFIIGGYVQMGNVLVPSGETNITYDSGVAVQINQGFELLESSLAHIIGLFLMVISVFAMMFSLFIGIGGGSY